MSYTVELHDDHYIAVLHEGAFSGRELFAARREFSELAKSSGVRRVLADVARVIGNISTFDTYEFSSSHHEYLPADIKIAVLIKNDQENDARFAEDVATNRGINIKMFTDKNDALRWLLQKPE